MSSIPNWITDDEKYNSESKAKTKFKKQTANSNFLITIVYNSGTQSLRNNPELRLKIYNVFNDLMPKLGQALKAKVILKPLGKAKLTNCQMTKYDFTIERAPSKGRIHSHAIAMFSSPCHIDLTKARTAINNTFKKALPDMVATNNLHFQVKNYRDTNKVLELYLNKQKENEPEMVQIVEDEDVLEDSDSDSDDEKNNDEPDM